MAHRPGGVLLYQPATLKIANGFHPTIRTSNPQPDSIVPVNGNGPVADVLFSSSLHQTEVEVFHIYQVSVTYHLRPPSYHQIPLLGAPAADRSLHIRGSFSDPSADLPLPPGTDPLSAANEIS